MIMVSFSFIRKRVLESHIIEFHENDHPQLINFFHEDISNVRKSLSPVKVSLMSQFPAARHSLPSQLHSTLLSPDSHVNNNRQLIDGSPVTTSPSVESKPFDKYKSPKEVANRVKNMTISFHTFLKITWKIIEECLGRKFAAHDISILRQLIFQHDR
jgi:hypothetical protein